LAVILAWGSLATHRDCSAVSISLLVSLAPFIISLSPSTVEKGENTGKEVVSLEAV
jgi:hypothetical protein